MNKQPKNRHFQDQALLPGEKGCGNKGDLLGVSLTLMVELDVTFDLSTGRTGRAQGAHKGTGECVKQRQKAKGRHHAKAGTAGYTFATLAHETPERRCARADQVDGRRGVQPWTCGKLCIRQELQDRAQRSDSEKECSCVTCTHMSVGPKDGKSFPERGIMSTCRIRIDPSPGIYSI